MTLLASKPNMCINKKALGDSAGVEEACRRMMAANTCHHRRRAKALAHQVKPHMPPVWDVEDLLSAGQNARGCPYYASREALQKAQLVFCPYNYIMAR
ncbi:unnamed protein product [Phaeothamnion confervicola]